MTYKLHVLNAGKDFKPEAVQLIESSVVESFELFNQYLPRKNFDIVCCHFPEATVPGEGIGGRTISETTILISMDAHRADLPKIIERQFKRILAHEYHHASRWRSVGYGKTLGEVLVSEGLADHFSLQLFPGEVQPWCKALSDAELKKWLNKAYKELDDEKYNHNEWFFGDGGTPQWMGYTVAFAILKRFFDCNPGKSAAEMTDVPSSFILQSSLFV